jgi:hypothetical protein
MKRFCAHKSPAFLEFEHGMGLAVALRMSNRIRMAIVSSFVSIVMACGGTTENVSGGSAGAPAAGGAGAAGAGGSGGGGGSGGSATGGAGGAASCALAPKGQFTFHIHNGGATPVKLALGCGKKLPIDLDTPDGKLGAGPGNADICEKSCDVVYAPMTDCPGFCTDCAAGSLATIAPGATDDIRWDRRVYVPKVPESACLNSGCPIGGNCALGIAVAPKSAQTGTLTICTDPNGVGVSCGSSRTVSFTIDTTSQEGTIETN